MTGWKKRKERSNESYVGAGSTNAGQVSAVAPSARSAEPVGATNSPVAEDKPERLLFVSPVYARTTTQVILRGCTVGTGIAFGFDAAGVTLGPGRATVRRTSSRRTERERRTWPGGPAFYGVSVLVFGDRFSDRGWRAALLVVLVAVESLGFLLGARWRELG